MACAPAWACCLGVATMAPRRVLRARATASPVPPSVAPSWLTPPVALAGPRWQAEAAPAAVVLVAADVVAVAALPLPVLGGPAMTCAPHAIASAWARSLAA